MLQAYKENELTDIGNEVNERLQAVWNSDKGNAGQLTPLGKRQHQEIAKRMYKNFPLLFSGNQKICARSSVVNRCIKSMDAFTNELKQSNPNLCINIDADSIYMSYIAFETPEMKAFGGKNAEWYQTHFSEFEIEMVKPERLLSTLFTSPDKIENPKDVMMELYWIASNMQDVDLDLSFYDLFQEEELFNIWQVINIECISAMEQRQTIMEYRLRVLAHFLII